MGVARKREALSMGALTAWQERFNLGRKEEATEVVLAGERW